MRSAIGVQPPSILWRSRRPPPYRRSSILPSCTNPSAAALPGNERLTEDTFIQIAKALADPTRHSIVREVRKAGELNCSQVCERFDHTQPTISHHIKTLEAAGIIKIEKDGPF